MTPSEHGTLTYIQLNDLDIVGYENDNEEYYDSNDNEITNEISTIESPSIQVDCNVIFQEIEPELNDLDPISKIMNLVSQSRAFTNEVNTNLCVNFSSIRCKSFEEIEYIFSNMFAIVIHIRKYSNIDMYKFDSNTHHIDNTLQNKLLYFK